MILDWKVKWQQQAYGRLNKYKLLLFLLLYKEFLRVIKHAHLVLDIPKLVCMVAMEALALL